MQSKIGDQDVSIIAEDIPVNRSHCLLSKYRIKTECVVNETVDLTQMASPPISEALINAREQRNQSQTQLHQLRQHQQYPGQNQVPGRHDHIYTGGSGLQQRVSILGDGPMGRRSGAAQALINGAVSNGVNTPTPAAAITAIVATAGVTASTNSNKTSLVAMDSELNECSKDANPGSSLADIQVIIQNRKGCSNISELQSISTVNMHEFLKSTPAESFSRKGFYSCAGCSSKFTSSEMYNFHSQRQVGEFSYECQQCGNKSIKARNLCQIVIHLLTVHKVSTVAWDKVSCKSLLSIGITTSDSSPSAGAGTGTAADYSPTNENLHDNGSTTATHNNNNTNNINNNNAINNHSNNQRDEFDEAARSNLKRVVENFLSDWNVDLFNPYQRASKDQRYFLLPMARKDVVQSHKFFSDHYRAANHKLKDYPVELMHCFMCDFVCESHNDLINHLQGDWPNSVTKCAFCTLSVPLNKEYLCAAKAHVLLHMGIFIMCPRCGFVPPPDLNPEEFEIALRLHLRYVCFHFNLIQIFICSFCGDSNSKAFNNSNQVTMHIFDEHLEECRSCCLCVSSATAASNTLNNEPPTFTLTDIKHHIYSSHNRSDVSAVWDECISVGKKCTECSDIIAQRDLYFNHMMTNHKLQIIKGKSAFRCFGTCKRIHQSIDEFQSHRPECSECVNVKNKLYQPHLANATPESTSLCFCLYCGVGVRRKRLENGDIETQSEPQMFANLSLTHDHEQDHISCETNVTACPWCPNRMSAKINEMTQHMETHLPENWFLSWYTKRSEKYNNNPSDIVYCYCYAAIDNPLSLHCHAIPQMLGSPNPNVSQVKHLALTDSIHREFLTAPRHRVMGACPMPMCSETDIITNSIEMSWHIFFKHRNVLCYVCKNFRLLNADNSPKCRITMWNHVYSCLRRHTPRFNMKNGLKLLQSIANCETVMKDCTVFDLKKSGEISVGLFPDNMDQEDSALSSGNTELANCVYSDYKYECGFCKETAIQSNFFSSRTILNDHLKSCHGITSESQYCNDYLCFVCGLKFDSRDKWEDHTLAEHSKGFRKIGLSLINPTAVVLDTMCTSYRCYLCNHRFDKKLSCASHMKDKHSIDDNELNWGMLTDTSDTNKRAKQSLNSSKMCLSTYPSKKLKVESSVSTEDNVFVCGICPFQCFVRKEMIEHATSFHIKSSEKGLNNLYCYVCPDCALSFTSEKSRNIHLKLVHKVFNPSFFMANLEY